MFSIAWLPTTVKGERTGAQHLMEYGPKEGAAISRFFILPDLPEAAIIEVFLNMALSKRSVLAGFDHPFASSYLHPKNRVAKRVTNGLILGELAARGSREAKYRGFG